MFLGALLKEGSHYETKITLRKIAWKKAKKQHVLLPRNPIT